MVSFQCNGCGDVVKKPKLDQHRQRCQSSFDCIDCSKTFNTPADYKSHTSCISEAEKYQKSLYKGPKTGAGADNARPNGASAAPTGTGPQAHSSWAALSRTSGNPVRGAGGGGRGGRFGGRFSRPVGTGANDTPLGTPTRLSPPTPNLDEAAPPPVADSPKRKMGEENHTANKRPKISQTDSEPATAAAPLDKGAERARRKAEKKAKKQAKEEAKETAAATPPLSSDDKAEQKRKRKEEKKAKKLAAASASATIPAVEEAQLVPVEDEPEKKRKRKEEKKAKKLAAASGESASSNGVADADPSPTTNGVAEDAESEKKRRKDEKKALKKAAKLLAEAETKTAAPTPTANAGDEENVDPKSKKRKRGDDTVDVLSIPKKEKKDKTKKAKVVAAAA